jgi:hypothetical protein
MQLRRFQISLRELVGITTGVAVAVALPLIATPPLVSLAYGIVAVLIVVVIALAASDVNGRVPMVAFVAGFFMHQQLIYTAAFNDPVVAIVDGMPDNIHFEHWTDGGTIRLIQLELSLWFGLFCAWLTRSLRRGHNS